MLWPRYPMYTLPKGGKSSTVSLLGRLLPPILIEFAGTLLDVSIKKQELLDPRLDSKNIDPSDRTKVNCP